MNEMKDKKTEDSAAKQLKKLTRLELVEIIVQKAKENEELHKKIQHLQNQLDERMFVCQESGNIAEAALKINQIFEACQKAADDYLNNIHKQNPLPASDEVPAADGLKQENEND